ncbi:hypothetical protein AB0B45_49890 [Nonomuraea sp. NPDC049152]
MEITGAEPARVCVHGAGAQAAAYFAHVMTNPRAFAEYAARR